MAHYTELIVLAHFQSGIDNKYQHSANNGSLNRIARTCSFAVGFWRDYYIIRPILAINEENSLECDHLLWVQLQSMRVLQRGRERQ